MFRTIIVVAAICSVSAFTNSFAKNIRRPSFLSMSAKDMVGSLPPVGFFDPLGLSNGKSPQELKKWREAELKHGRVAMLAALGFVVGETFNPLFDGQITGPAIYHFQQADDIVSFFWEIVLFSVALVEGQNIISGWESVTDTGGRLAYLKDDYVNGDLEFDPLNLKPSNLAAFDKIRTKELQNGRVAMLGVAGML